LVDGDWVELFDVVCLVDCLCFGCGVLSGVEDEDIVGFG